MEYGQSDPVICIEHYEENFPNNARYRMEKKNTMKTLELLVVNTEHNFNRLLGLEPNRIANASFGNQPGATDVQDNSIYESIFT